MYEQKRVLNDLLKVVSELDSLKEGVRAIYKREQVAIKDEL